MNTRATVAARHRLNPGKLLLSKWTAVSAQNREKHFLVTELLCDADGQVLQVELQAVLSRRNQYIDWRDLQDRDRWRMGWQPASR
ncbi:TIGR02450 family Trp-rich protein [Pseudomonas sp. SA3-5]|uniref:TIGR02450 family Trp-rich protein n=1 Tax=Pseudomonas aestuarii TaxID=3018340 RepID=A0ABT4XFZ0_9PSED|nr:TIGR02450 family Trp-rich protein [Pseudomonas aestuarii]MDA7087112.1 TIGR02450 family Trp-rich protein [Pseudomonas aestuarii]